MSNSKIIITAIGVFLIVNFVAFSGIWASRRYTLKKAIWEVVKVNIFIFVPIGITLAIWFYPR